MNQSQDVIVSVVIAVLSVVAIFVNALASAFVYKKATLRNGFGIICASHSLAEILQAVINLCWCAPLVAFLDHDAWSRGSVGYGLSYISLMGSIVVVNVQLLKAVNRLVAIARPPLYYMHFTIAATRKILVLVWVLSALKCLPFAFDGCHIYYDGANYYWIVEQTACGKTANRVLNYYGSPILSILSFACDCTTMYLLWAYRARQVRTVEPATSSGPSGGLVTPQPSSAAQSARSRDVRFLLQSAIYNLVCISINESQRFLSTEAYDHWIVRLLLATAMYILQQIVDGFE
ncbi:CRE-SRX-13 protein [Aphelenchoides avenae]|nr:CRE-SRX-13 protein [Aphelenchus avenae]